MSLNCPACDTPLDPAQDVCPGCGHTTPAPPSADPEGLSGQLLLGRYRVLRPIGQGGMGTVYLAEQQMGQVTRRVALKVLRRGTTMAEELRGRFRRESEVVIQLSHPNTIQFYDFAELDDGSLVIAMEYIDGTSLAVELDKGPIDIPRAERILFQICESLHEAHGLGIVHRDLKPHNVLLTRRGDQEDFVKVLDFGLAKRHAADDDSETALTRSDVVLGTPPYMSPEQFEGHTLDRRSDIYSLGVLAYLMLAGRLPFRARTPWAWASKHMMDAPDPIQPRPGLKPHHRAAVMRALSKKPAKRQSDAREFCQEFSGERAAGRARAGGYGGRARGLRTTLAVAVGTGLAAAGAAWALWPGTPSAEPRGTQQATADSPQQRAPAHGPGQPPARRPGQADARVETPRTQPPPVEPPPVEPARLDKAARYASEGLAALEADDLSGAIDALASAQGLVGRAHPSLQELTGRLQRVSAIRVGLLIQRDRCAAAQLMYRRLQRVGAEEGARAHFSSGGCPLARAGAPSARNSPSSRAP